MAANRKLGACDFCSLMWVVACVSMVTICAVRCDENSKQRKYTMEELLTMSFPMKYSGDLDMDPCKAGEFMGDIAIPNVDYGERWDDTKLNKTLQEEVERLKQEVLLEGLQVEEEGLTDILRKRTKHPTDNEEDKGKYNDATLGIKGPIPLSENSLKSQNLNPNINVARPQISIVSQNITTARVEINPSQMNNATTTPRTNNAVQILEQDGVLAVNISKNNIIKPEDILIEMITESSSNKTKSPELQNEKLGKIQSNTREITGDANGNLQKKDTPASSVGPAPTNGILTEQKGTNKPQSDPVEMQRGSISVAHFKPRDSEELRLEESVVKSKQTKRRRRHGGKRWMTEEALSEEWKKSEDSLRPLRRIANVKPHQKKHKKHRKRPRKYAIADFPRSKDDKFEVPVHEFERKFEVVPEKKNTTSGFTSSKATVLVDPIETINWTRYVHSTENSTKSRIDHLRARRAATGRKERIWENGIIPYEIDGNFSGAHKALFKQAMRHWENFTCVKFVERDLVEHVNYIVFTERTCGCCSFVGKRGNGAQAISIGKNCDKFGIVVHELGHVVGFWHEHTRPDRDRHVQIIRDNILTGQEYNFNKLTEEEVNSLGQTYDYDSIMHYARNTFSKGTYLDTILPLEVHGKRRPEIGQRVRLSESDIAQTNLLYKCAKCGRTLQESSGWFSSPGWSSGPSNQALPSEGDKCEWRITATHGERIILNITELDIQKSEGCSVEYVEVVDGYGPKASSLGRWCGSGRVPALRSSGARLTVLYRAAAADGSEVKDYRGFNAHYEAVCGGELDLEAGGHLESPNYPDDYQPNKECVWKLTVPEEYQVALKFQSFEVENHDSCIYDYVEVRDGHTSDSPLIGVFCGYKIPPDIRSTSNKLLVKFVSDGSVQKAGFSAHFMQEHDECAVQTHGCQHECVNTLGGYECSCNIGYELRSDGKTCEDACGGILDDLNGTITSPSFPDAYPPSKSCLWEIVAPLRHRITLNFTHFDLEGNDVYQQECEYDAVTVHSVLVGGVLRRHGAWCGIRRPAPITSDGSALRITFTSDNSVHKSGFAAIYYIDMDECAVNNGGCQHECRNTLGGYECACHSGFNLHENRHDCKEGGCKHDVTQPHGTILSPNYPDVYPSSKDCVWHFTTTPGHRIKLLFNIFELEQHQECAYDHVTIYDGENADAHTLGRFCGSKPPHPIIASHNQMYVVFKSDASVQRKGFIATHSTACGGHLMASSRPRHLYSHARYGAEHYDPRADCDWRIEAPSGHVVRLSFLTFQLEAEDHCGYDYVEIFGGLDASGGPTYGSFCGNDAPKDIISLSEALIVRFRTDDSLNFKGFSASYVAIEPNYEETDDDEEEMAAIINPYQQTSAPSWTYRIQPYIQRRQEKHNNYNLRH